MCVFELGYLELAIYAMIAGGGGALGVSLVAAVLSAIVLRLERGH